MITAKQIYAMFKRHYPELTITEMFNYDSNNVVVVAIENTGLTDYNSPLYSVNKVTGRITPFNPIADMGKFQTSRREGQINFSLFN